MSRLKLLEFQRLLKELQFVESDYLFQSEILKQAESQFFNSVTIILEKYPDLKNLWDDKITKSSDTSNVENITKISEIQTENLKPVIEPEVKKLYRDIVKHTHPDRIKNPKLNELYLEATAAYEINDVVNLFKVCNDLMIEVEWSEEVLSKVEERINTLKNQIHFLESTFTFKWLKSSDDYEKNNILLRFIENTIR
jgi:hypothetical protein